jgi:predicted DCC family thiol-disulfide oxidoreductase YuxK
VLYDGYCSFCRESVGLLLRTVGEQRLDVRSVHDEGLLASLPGLTLSRCLQRMHVIAPDGRVFTGAEAIARCLSLTFWGLPALVYYLPLLGPLAEWLYTLIAARRYRLFARRNRCDSDACAASSDATMERRAG